MNAIVLMVLGLGGFVLAYFLYAKFIARRVFALDPDYKTPAYEYEDGVDFVPTSKYVLWGHHFTSIAGAAPIVGPAIAVIWGWVPAFLWVVLGTIFFAGVHDAGAIWASLRNKARSVGAISGDLVGPQARSLFMIVIFLLVLMVNAVFAVVISGLFVDYPESVLPAWSAIAVALVLGQLIYRRIIGLLWLSIIGVGVLYFTIYLGSLFPLEITETHAGLAPNAQWIIILFVYAAVASMLPVWMLLQPRDYINGLQLFIGLGLIYAAILLVGPTVVAPAINQSVPEGTPSMIPLLFVTIACGAVSGFHGLVSSGTTSKQIRRETDVPFVGYLGSVGEGALALATIIATTAGIATIGEWRELYSSFSDQGVEAFVEGGGALVAAGINLPVTVAQTLLAVMAVLFAATTMDTGLRIQRYIIQEWGEIYNLGALKRGVPATLIAVAACLLLAFGAGGASGEGGMLIWPLFGTTNQLLAALTLLVISLIIARAGRAIWFTAIPMLFLLVMTVSALIVQLVGFYNSGEWFLLGLDILILVASIFVVLQTGSAVAQKLRERPQAAE